MFTKTNEEAEMWLTCLKFLSELKSKELETATSSRGSSYFHTLTNNLGLNNEIKEEFFSEEQRKRKSKSRGR